jgi:hypothetical protein
MGGTVNALQLLADLQACGIELAVAGNRLRWRPRDALTDTDRQSLARHKAELLALLSASGEVQSPVLARHSGPLPPLGARLFYQDADGRPCASGAPYMWTWEGAPSWFHARDYPPPPHLSNALPACSGG